MDRMTKDQRSAHMRRIKKVNTKPEIAVRSAAHGLGLRFRLHSKGLPGTPDLVFPRHRVAIFVHGCFWHQHGGCRLARIPKSRTDYWLPKFQRNQARDTRNVEALREAGWRVAVIWECETADARYLSDRVRDFFVDLSVQPSLSGGELMRADS